MEGRRGRGKARKGDHRNGRKVIESSQPQFSIPVYTGWLFPQHISIGSQALHVGDATMIVPMCLTCWGSLGEKGMRVDTWNITSRPWNSENTLYSPVRSFSLSSPPRNRSNPSNLTRLPAGRAT